MSTHPDITIALAYQRMAEHHEWAARRRLGALATARPTGRRRSIMQSLARLGDRRERKLAEIAIAPVATPFPAATG